MTLLSPTPALLEQALGPQFNHNYERLREEENPLVIKLGGSAISHANRRDTVAALSTLHSLELPFVIVHGGRNQITTALQEQGMHAQYDENNNRFTDDKTLETVQEVLPRLSRRIARDLRDLWGVRSEIVDDALLAEPLSKDDGQHIGSPLGVETSDIRHILSTGKVPIVSSLGWKDERPLNVSVGVAASQYAIDLGTHKLIGLVRNGVLRDERNQKIPVVTVGHDGTNSAVDRLIEQKSYRSASMMPKIKDAMEFVRRSPESTAVLTDPRFLIRELFTHQGEGTLVRSGNAIRSLSPADGVDEVQVRSIVEEAFGDRKLSDDYFEQLPRDAQILITDRQYHGVAVIIPDSDSHSAAYLDKIAVAPIAQGVGVGKELIEKAVADNPNGLYWRTKSSNLHNVAWYTNIADRYTTEGEWVVFGINITDDVAFADCVAKASHRSTTI